MWAADFYIPKLGMFTEICGSKNYDYEYREEMYKKNGYQAIFVHLYKEKQMWKDFLLKRIVEINFKGCS